MTMTEDTDFAIVGEGIRLRWLGVAALIGLLAIGMAVSWWVMISIIVVAIGAVALWLRILPHMEV